MDDHGIPHVPPAAFHFMTGWYDALTEIFGFGTSLKRRVFGMLGAKDGDTILDVGCGTGTFLAIAAEALPHSRLIGIDPDRGALAIARKKLRDAGSRVRLEEASAEKLPLADATVDACVSTLAFHHMPKSIKQKAIEEICRTLKPGGIFLLADFGKPRSIVSTVLLWVGSLVDGRESMKANLEGVLPFYLKERGFSVSEAAKPYRGVEFLLARKRGV